MRPRVSDSGPHFQRARQSGAAAEGLIGQAVDALGGASLSGDGAANEKAGERAVSGKRPQRPLAAQAASARAAGDLGVDSGGTVTVTVPRRRARAHTVTATAPGLRQAHNPAELPTLHGSLMRSWCGAEGTGAH